MNFLKRLYPNTLNRWGLIILISLFIGLFLSIFQPFGLQMLEIEHKGLLLAGYGMVTLIVLIFNMKLLPLLFPRVFYDENWTVLRQLIWLIWIVITISIGNYFYSIGFSIVRWVGFDGMLIFLAFTFLVALIPVTLVTFISQNVYLKRNMASSTDINNSIYKQEKKEDTTKEVVSFESGKQSEDFIVSDIIYLESEGNYIQVYFMKEGEIKNTLIRNTLKNIEAQLIKYTTLLKCHRAFIVNLSYVEKVKGNSQGYSLILKDIKEEIPVARSYTKEFKNSMLN